MKINIAGRKITLSDSFKERVEKKLGKLDKFFGENAEAQVTVSVQKNSQTVEVTIKDGKNIFRDEQTAPKMEIALDCVVDSLIRKIRKNKTRISKKMKASAFDFLPESETPITEESEYKIVKDKKFDIAPMDVEEAILQMNMVGHDFYVFQNSETGDINVVYCREHGDYGLIEPTAK